MNERRSLLLTVVVVAVLGVAAGGLVVAGASGADGGSDVPGVNSTGHPNVEHGLLAGDGSVAAESGDTDGIRVVVEATAGRGDEAADAAADRGTVEAHHGNLIQATVPRDRIESLGEEPAVAFVRTPLRPEQAELTSEGVETIRANVAADRNATGDGATVALIDLGFDPDHPPIADNVVETKDFSGEGIEGPPYIPTSHGDAVGEIVVDVAPDADLILVTAETGLQLLNAMEWVNAHEDVDAVGMSLGFKGGVPNDGTSVFDQEIDDGVESGTAWFVSSGNEGDGQHWHGQWRDEDGDDLLEFSDPGADADECNDFQAAGFVEATLQWNDWPTSDQRYALELLKYDDTSGAFERVAFSNNAQSPDNSVRPREQVSYSPQESGVHDYCLAIHRENADGTADFDLFTSDGIDLEYSTVERSVTPPATTKRGIAVGAVYWDTETLEPYSSRGPTIDGRLKPEIVAPARVSTEAYGQNGFAGTSAAAPHAAGAAALVHGANASATGAGLQDRVVETAVAPDGENYGSYPNDAVGYGLTDAALAVPPQNPRNVSVAGPVDNESVDAVSVTVAFGAEPKPGDVTVRFEDGVGDTVTATAPTDTTDGTTNVTVNATTLADGTLTVTASATGDQGWSNAAGYTATETVQKDVGPSLDDYAGESDVVQNAGLRQAVDDWRAGDIETGLLRDVVDAWRTGETVA
ncbi:S8 family serine peptidase [Natronomonas marina]|jgi:hypothetical protein|uniref:S8 family serine peptidase n=1 Tax=Natronomonas marina TaxID=2961939 RepID=UPI0020C9A923|nr:S8 family serine peptidase [Natronomonas marina]